MSELGERFAREEMERDERMEMLIEDLGLEGPALEEYLRVHRQIEMEMMMDELRGEEQFSSPAAQRTLDEIEKHVKNGRYFDLTAAQFWNYNLPLHHEPNEEMPRSICGRNPDTATRHKLLVAKIAERVKSETEENVCMS